MERKPIVIATHTRSSRDPIEVRRNAKKAIAERWRKYYANQKKVLQDVE